MNKDREALGLWCAKHVYDVSVLPSIPDPRSAIVVHADSSDHAVLIAERDGYRVYGATLRTAGEPK